MSSFLNIFWLGLKEIRSLLSDAVMVLFVVYAFTLAIYVQATGTSSEVNNASIAFADEDQSALSKELSIPQAELIVRKGYHKDVDSYSAFTEADGKTTTGLAAWLKARKLQRLFIAGLATDFCVAWTALDARKAGFDAYVVEDACRGIDTQGSLAKAWADMEKAGVKRIQSSDIVV